MPPWLLPLLFVVHDTTVWKWRERGIGGVRGTPCCSWAIWAEVQDTPYRCSAHGRNCEYVGFALNPKNSIPLGPRQGGGQVAGRLWSPCVHSDQELLLKQAKSVDRLPHIHFDVFALRETSAMTSQL